MPIAEDTIEVTAGDVPTEPLLDLFDELAPDDQQEEESDLPKDKMGDPSESVLFTPIGLFPRPSSKLIVEISTWILSFNAGRLGI